MPYPSAWGEGWRIQDASGEAIMSGEFTNSELSSLQSTPRLSPCIKNKYSRSFYLSEACSRLYQSRPLQVNTSTHFAGFFRALQDYPYINPSFVDFCTTSAKISTTLSNFTRGDINLKKHRQHFTNISRNLTKIENSRILTSRD